MLNKRKLIQLLLAYNYSENTFYDLKEEIDSSNSIVGKAKLLKLISALSNSNPSNDSFIIVGIEDETFKLNGVHYSRDEQIQDLVKEYLDNPPKVIYENVTFPDLLKGFFIGLPTISPNPGICRLKKNIQKLRTGDAYIRLGSQSVLLEQEHYVIDRSNKETVESIKHNANVSLSATIDGILQFYDRASESYNPQHIVFNDHYVLCYSGWKENDNYRTLWSEVNVEVINENVSLFYSALTNVEILTTTSSFKIVEQVFLFFNGNRHFLPFKETEVYFHPNGRYEIRKSFVFQVPKVDQESIAKMLENYKTVHNKLMIHEKLSEHESIHLEVYCYELVVCMLNGNREAQFYFDNYLLKKVDGHIAESYYDAKKVLEECRTQGLLVM